MINSTTDVVKITSATHRADTSILLEALKGIGVHGTLTTAARTSVLRERAGFAAIFQPGMALVDQPADLTSFFADPILAGDLIKFVAGIANFDKPGKGSVFAEKLALDLSYADFKVNVDLKIPASRSVHVYEKLTGITCIVQRGQATEIAQTVLEMGACVPVTTYGVGAGIRDKLGLLRITIPAEKEVVRFVVSDREAEHVLDRVIESGRLDQPGKGFVFTFEVESGIIDTATTRGSERHGASLEQIVSTLDSLKGGMEWRRHGGDKEGGSARNWLRGIDLSFICEQGRGMDLAKVAMAAGAPGATIGELRLTNSDEGSDSPARELCNMMVPADAVPKVVEAIEADGLKDERTRGIVFHGNVDKAFTYLGKS